METMHYQRYTFETKGGGDKCKQGANTCKQGAVAGAETGRPTAGAYFEPTSVHDFNVKDTIGNTIPLSRYKGYVLVIVNIASKGVGTQGNYDDLRELHNHYKDKGLKILAFPCNQFMKDMPESDGYEILEKLREEDALFGDIFAKVKVNGDDAEPLFKFLKDKQGGFMTDSIKWNFTKFLINKQGIPVDRFAPTTSLTDYQNKINALLLE